MGLQPMKPRVFSVVLAILAAVVMISAASARIGYGAPGIDDATTLWPQVWELKLGVDAGAGIQMERSDVSVIRVPASIRYGWRERLEWGFWLPFAYQQSDNFKFDGGGISDINIALKYQMTEDEGGSTPATATEVRLGYGSSAAVASNAISIGINYSISKAFGERGAGHLNLGYTFYTATRPDVLNWAAAYEYRIMPSLRGSAGLTSGSQLLPGARNDIIAELGLTREAGPTLEYSLAGGIGLTKESPNWMMRFGITKELGRGAGEATPFRRGEWNRPAAPTAAVIIQKGEEAARTGDYSLAISYYRDAIVLDSTISSAWNNMGIAYFKLGRTSEALSAYENAAQINPSNADIYFNMGLAHYKLGDLYEARRSFARSLQLNPEHSLARSNLMALEGRTGSAPSSGAAPVPSVPMEPVSR